MTIQNNRGVSLSRRLLVARIGTTGIRLATIPAHFTTSMRFFNRGHRIIHLSKTEKTADHFCRQFHKIAMFVQAVKQIFSIISDVDSVAISISYTVSACLFIGKRE